jgi:hypothetical protein
MIAEPVCYLFGDERACSEAAGEVSTSRFVKKFCHAFVTVSSRLVARVFSQITSLAFAHRLDATTSSDVF